MDLKIRWPPHYPQNSSNLGNHWDFRAKSHFFWVWQKKPPTSSQTPEAMKAESQCSTVCGSSPLNCLDLFFFFKKLKRQDIGKQKSIKKTVETSSPPPKRKKIKPYWGSHEKHETKRNETTTSTRNFPRRPLHHSTSTSSRRVSQITRLVIDRAITRFLTFHNYIYTIT